MNIEDSKAIDSLIRLGLSTSEARTYIALLKSGPTSPANLSKLAQIPQPKIYGYLESLEKSGFAELSDIQGRVKIYFAKPYEFVLNQLEKEINDRITYLSGFFKNLKQDEQSDVTEFFILHEGSSRVNLAVEEIFIRAKKNLIILSKGFMEDKINSLMKQYSNLNYSLPTDRQEGLMKLTNMLQEMMINEEIQRLRPLVMFVDYDIENPTISETIISCISDPELGIADHPVLLRIKHPTLTRLQALIVKRILFMASQIF
jgi:sugar-specific transcriptional regulator TrmB